MSRDSLREVHQEIQKAFGPPAILVNAAGGNDPKTTVTAERPVEQITVADWQANFDLNVIGGVLLPCQEFGPAMAARGRGSIINIGSVSAGPPLSRVVSYSASKAAVISLTQFLAREWAVKNVRVNAISPGFFPAEQNRKLLFNEDGSPTPRAASILAHTPMARFGKSGGIGWGGGVSGQPQSQQFCDRVGNPRGRRVSGADDLTGMDFSRISIRF